jgi:hypothetical protein
MSFPSDRTRALNLPFEQIRQALKDSGLDEAQCQRAEKALDHWVQNRVMRLSFQGGKGDIDVWAEGRIRIHAEDIARLSSLVASPDGHELYLYVVTDRETALGESLPMLAPLPWRAQDSTILADKPFAFAPSGAENVEHYGGFLVAESMTKTNAAHAVNCVNSCQGINPEAVPMLVKLAGSAVEYLEGAYGDQTPPETDPEWHLLQIAKQALALAEVKR